jgi:hypothetical protein
MPPIPSDPLEAFLSRWGNSGAAERANYQMFLSELCDHGLVTVLKQLHDELDAAVLGAYGWSDLKESPHFCGAAKREEQGKRQSDDSSAAPAPPRQECRGSLRDDLLTRLVALNHERAAEEQRGLIRWLRPDYQAPQSSDGHRTPLQTEIGLSADDSSTETPTHRSTEIPASWPDRLPDQVTLLRHLLATDPTATPETLSARFGRKNKKRTEQIEGILETLRGLGLM